MKELSASALALIFLFADNLIVLPACANSAAINSGQISSVSFRDQSSIDKNASNNTSELETTQAPENKILELKPDSAKLDQTKTDSQKHKPLKGSVQHQEVIKNKQSGIFGNSHGQLDGNVRQGRVDGNANKNLFRSRLNSNRPSDVNEVGLGIIGVKFVMGFGRLPTIYEVFPGTPAAEAGMRVRDILIAVDGIPTMGLSKDEIYNMIVGQPDTTVTISYRRKSDFQVRTMKRMDLNKIGDPRLKRDYLKM